MRLSVLLMLLVSPAASQSFFANPSSVYFDTTVTTVTDSAALWLVNTTGTSVYVYDVNVYGDVFSVSDTAFHIPNNDSARTWIRFSSIHNLTYTGFAFIETNLKSGSVVVPLHGTKKYAEALYATTQGKSGEELKTALNAITKLGHVSLGYDVARDRMYGNIDNIGGQVECVYTGRVATFNTRAGATSNNFNCEHTWPQSKFSEADPMKADIHHLFPTDVSANSKRSNYPFAAVVTASWNVGGSKYGTASGGQTVFEPRDAHKGDLARSMFYFITRYPVNYGAFWNDAGVPQETFFREWNKKYPPTQKSKARNDGIQLYQGNRNPFTDHPEFVDRINNFTGTATVVTSARLVASPMVLDFGETFSISDPNKKLILANTGDKVLTISSIVISNSGFELTDTITMIMPNGYRTVNVKIVGVVDSGTMTVNYTDGNAKQLVIGLIGYIIDSVNEDEYVPDQFVLKQNFPNPFNPVTTIPFTIPSDLSENITLLKVYDVLGREVEELVNERLMPGEHSVRFDGSALAGGVYLYRLTHGTFVQTEKMVLQK
jgi:endonuclease I